MSLARREMHVNSSKYVMTFTDWAVAAVVPVRLAKQDNGQKYVCVVVPLSTILLLTRRPSGNFPSGRLRGSSTITRFYDHTHTEP